MRKIVYPKAGGVETIQIVDVEDPLPGKGQVCVRVHRAGVNFAELMMRQGLYGSSPDFPFTPVVSQCLTPARVESRPHRVVDGAEKSCSPLGRPPP